MILNISTIVNLRYELECKFKKKLFEERARVEERTKNLSILAFAELYSFFEKLHMTSLESQLSEVEMNSASFESIITRRFAEGSLKFSELLCKIKGRQQSKIDEYLVKKSEIESKIASLKSKIASRENKLNEINVKITNIDSQSAKLEDPDTINQLDEQIKSVQKDLEEQHKQSISDIVDQKKVSEDVKSVAKEMVQDEVEKVKEVTEEAKNNETGAKKPADQQTQQLVFEFAKETNEAIKENNTSAKIEDELVEEAGIEKDSQPVEAPDAPVQLEFDFMNEAEQPEATKKEDNPELPVENKPEQLVENQPEEQQEVLQPEQPDLPVVDEPVVNQPEQPVAQPDVPENPVVHQPDEAPKVEEAEIVSKTQTGEEVVLEKHTENEKQDKEKVNSDIQAIAENLNVDQNEVNKVVEETAQNEEVGIVEDITSQPVQEPAQPALPPETPVAEANSEDDVKQKLQESVDTVKTVKETSSEITENVDKKLSSLSDELSESNQKLKENKENIEKAETEKTQQQTNDPEQGINNQTGVEKENSTEKKKEMITETTNNLKEVALKQKEVIDVQKEALTALEESAKKLIDDVALGDVEEEEATESGKKKAVSVSVLKNLIEEAVEMLSELMDDLFAAVQGKKKQSKVTDDSVMLDMSKFSNASSEEHTDISSLKKMTSQTEDELKKVKTEVFYISGEMKSVDKILKNAKELGSKADKIVVDRQLENVFDKLSSELGNDKVVLDRRQGDRRQQADRRLPVNSGQHNGFSSTLDQLKQLDDVELAKNLSDSERREKSDRRDSSDRRQAQQVSFMNMDELDQIINYKNQNWSGKL